MARKPPPPADTSRKLASSKIWNGAIYSPGMEDQLPEDFPMDGPHWADHIEDEPEAPKGQAAVNLAKQEASAEPDVVPELDESADTTVAKAGHRAPARKSKGRK